jgi:hypothetical protein
MENDDPDFEERKDDITEIEKRLRRFAGEDPALDAKMKPFFDKKGDYSNERWRLGIRTLEDAKVHQVKPDKPLKLVPKKKSGWL